MRCWPPGSCAPVALRVGVSAAARVAGEPSAGFLLDAARGRAAPRVLATVVAPRALVAPATPGAADALPAAVPVALPAAVLAMRSGAPPATPPSALLGALPVPGARFCGLPPAAEFADAT